MAVFLFCTTSCRGIRFTIQTLTAFSVGPFVLTKNGKIVRLYSFLIKTPGNLIDTFASKNNLKISRMTILH